jgi:putative transposase
VAAIDRDEAAFCVETLEDALARHGSPDNFNIDHGSRFTGRRSHFCLPATSSAWTAKALGATTCFVERSVKREEVSLRAYESVSEARKSIGRYLDIIAAAHIRALTAAYPIKPTSTRCRSSWQPN